MKATNLLFWCALFISGTAICRGELGETEAQCIARYGPEAEVQDNLGFDVVGDKAASFNLETAKGSFLVYVIFLNGFDVCEHITNGDATRDISDDQKLMILDLESAGLKWKKGSASYHTDRKDITSGAEKWARTDGARAICWMTGKLKLEHGWMEIDLSTRQYASAQQKLDNENGAR